VRGKTVDWIKQVVRGIDEHTDDATCARILEACGRQCTPASLIKKAKAIYAKRKDVGAFLAEFSEVFDAIQVEDDVIYVVYPRCFCKQIAGIPPEEILDAYCNCSRGWIMQLFEQATGREVDVELLESVVKGDPQCRFAVRFKGDAR
jgi:predicted hydrocarbon binding protein